MENFSFKKTERLVKRPQFQKVMEEGKKKRVERLCTIFFVPNELDRKRLGIIASKKIGNAVARNRAKRRIREVFRKLKHRMEPALDIVIISGKDMVTLPYRVIEKKLSNALLAER
ncbi:MAG: ribonuclease P protein component [Nitrospina sp.]|jgi:ribonuclease P protein component|nr:ribonuclease P protein component [Nitrospina sp.]MBT3414412.1 ribonuclease P protein component [Nitrospina sp.]MBT4105145.1 ribonuclease P protein component [Nitrospina sp.]MBT4388113.1 ribonuclease P protein component [Nitrospina sp.]MBT4620219.1 ribonuclease P protein component [Nitrospina sp.]